MATCKVLEVLRNDRWKCVQGENDVGPCVLRYRTPVLTPAEINGYGHVLKIVWPYADDNIGAMPSADDTEQMAEFEDRFRAAVEHDATAILTADLTFDGARQWVYYTGDVQECGVRLNNMPQSDEPYPLELTTEDDPRWEYLRDEILKDVPKE
jgi:Family of unknown function (DUF695)